MTELHSVVNASRINPALLLGIARGAYARHEFAQAIEFFNRYLVHHGAANPSREVNLDFIKTAPPDDVLSALLDLGTCFWRVGLHAYAEDVLSAALASYQLHALKHPEFDESDGSLRHMIRGNLSIVQLCRGNLRAGFENYESRRYGPQKNNNHANRPVLCREWTGGSLKGKLLLVRGEQGIGDELQWLRLIPTLAARFEPDAIVYESSEKALPVARMLLPETVCDVPIGAMSTGYVGTLPKAVYIPLCSIGRILFEKPEDIVPYKFPVRHGELYRKVRGGDSRPRVGVCWRSLSPLKDNRLYLEAADVEKIIHYPLQNSDVYCLQPGATMAGALTLNFDLYGDLRALAAYLDTLDIVIGQPSATTALAAALGVETWVLALQEQWHCHGSEFGRSPWFPAMRVIHKLWNEPKRDYLRRVEFQLWERLK